MSNVRDVSIQPSSVRLDETLVDQCDESEIGTHTDRREGKDLSSDSEKSSDHQKSAKSVSKYLYSILKWLILLKWSACVLKSKKKFARNFNSLWLKDAKFQYGL